MAKQNRKAGPELQEPGPGRSTAEPAFDALRKQVAERNERAHEESRKRRAAKDREQILRRRAEDL
jgi:hypothetical protein